METTPAKIKTWDLATRLWHWVIVCLIAFLWYSGDFADDLMQWHLLAGRAVLALVIFRIIWGFIGSETARFKNFLRPPKTAISELKGLFNSSHQRYLGHNPAGGWFVVLLLALIFLQAASGLFVSDGYLWEGPWAESVSSDTQDFMMSVHGLGINLILAAIALHISAIAVHSLKGDHLVGAMITGNKKDSPNLSNQRPTMWRSPWLALTVMAGCAVLVFGVTN